MKHETISQFWQHYHQLPTEIQDLADKNFKLLKSNPQHPSLHFKKIGRLWSVRVGIHYRALALDKGETAVWFWIGAHPDYEKLLSRV